MRLLVIGAVAAGTSAAAKARRGDPQAEIVIYEKDSFISYSGCGMPYYLSGVVEEAEELYPRDAASFKSKYQIDVYIRHEVLTIRPAAKEIEVKNLDTGEVFADRYDKLVIATGARPVVPPIPGSDGQQVFALRTISDMHRIKAFLSAKKPQHAVIIGSGFIGLELAESFTALGMKVSLLERLPHVMASLDDDMAALVADKLRAHHVQVATSANVTRIGEKTVDTEDGRSFPADLVILATGVRPNSELTSAAGIELGMADSIRVNPRMETNIPDIYACGDCAENVNLLTGRPFWHPLGTTANKMGRICGDSLTGGELTYRGSLGTGILRLFDLTVGQTGLTEQAARDLGYDVVVVQLKRPHRNEYMGSEELIIKGVADRGSGRLLGVQLIGQAGVDKRLDVFVTAITYGAKVDDLFHLDLAYAPPYSTTKDPVMYTGMVLDGIMNED